LTVWIKVVSTDEQQGFKYGIRRCEINVNITQFVASVGRVFHVIGIVLAAYSVRWERGGGTSLASLLHSGNKVFSQQATHSFRSLHIVCRAAIKENY
jgi:hypothetical protein